MAVVVIVLVTGVMIVTVVMIVRMLDVVIVVMPAIMAVIVIAVMIVVVLLEDGFQVLGKSQFGRAINFPDWNSAFGRDLRARFKFGREQRTLAVSPAELAVQLADRCLDDARLPSTF